MDWTTQNGQKRLIFIVVPKWRKQIKILRTAYGRKLKFQRQ